MDVQPSLNGGMVIFVNGDMLLGEEQTNPIKFAQVFQILTGGPAEWYSKCTVLCERWRRLQRHVQIELRLRNRVSALVLLCQLFSLCVRLKN